MIFIIIVIISILLLLMFWLYSIFKKSKGPKAPKIKKVKEKPQKRKEKEEVANFKNVNLSVKQTYMQRKELLFWKYLNSILPNQFIVVPKVAVIDLIVPNGDKNVFNMLTDKTLDYVIFNQSTMYPALIVDIYDKTYNDIKLDEQDPFLINIFEKLHIKFIQILVSSNFDREITQKQIYEKLGVSTKEDA